MDICINNGWVIDPGQRISSQLNVGIKNGKIECITPEPLKALREIDATGLIVSPAFIDGHMHEGPQNSENGQVDMRIFRNMLQMGVGTAIGGNCGEGALDPAAYLDSIDGTKAPVNVGMLIPHGSLRRAVGATDKYVGVTEAQILEMVRLAKRALKRGCLGISFGIRYIPGIDDKELMGVSDALRGTQKVLAAHVRDDASQVFKAVAEFLDVASTLNLRAQVSHIGSMGAYGQMEALLSLVDSYRSMGVKVSMDCYPYTAFSTGIGETTYDEGFLERYGIGYDRIEVGEGVYRGQRLNQALFEKLRAEAPQTITIGHVMDAGEINRALQHPNVIIASDGFLHNNQGHPRAAGTFPRILGHYVRDLNLLDVYQAIEKMTTLPAVQFGLAHKGVLTVGFDADITLFDPLIIKDRATFDEPCLAPEGIEYVILAGQIALEKGVIIHDKLGTAVRF